MYVIMEIWFDIDYAVSTVSQFTSNLISKNVATVKQIFRHIWKYSNLGIMFSKDNAFELERHIDSNWVMDLNTQ